jgi:hypothetical protein
MNLHDIIKGKEEIQDNATSNAKVEELDFIASNINPIWKSQNYDSNYQKPYPNQAGIPISSTRKVHLKIISKLLCNLELSITMLLLN